MTPAVTKVKRIAYKANRTCCHICGLFIPPNIVDRKDPLFGTIDHVIPKSLGGLDIAENREPSHKHCNWEKGQGEVTDELRSECRTVIGQQFLYRQHLMPRRDNLYQNIVALWPERVIKFPQHSIGVMVDSEPTCPRHKEIPAEFYESGAGVRDIPVWLCGFWPECRMFSLADMSRGGKPLKMWLLAPKNKKLKKHPQPKGKQRHCQCGEIATIQPQLTIWRCDKCCTSPSPFVPKEYPEEDILRARFKTLLYENGTALETIEAATGVKRLEQSFNGWVKSIPLEFIREFLDITPRHVIMQWEDDGGPVYDEPDSSAYSGEVFHHNSAEQDGRQGACDCAEDGDSQIESRVWLEPVGL